MGCSGHMAMGVNMDDETPRIDLEDVYTKLDRLELDLMEQVRQTRWMALAACFGIIAILEKLYF